MQEVHKGTYFPVSGEIVPIYSKNKMTGMAICCRNISEEEMHKRFFNLAVDHRNRTYRPIGCKYGSISVNDLTSCCLNIPFPFMQIFCFLLIVLCIKYHQIYQSSDQIENQDKRRQKNNQNFLFMKRFIFHNKNPHKNFHNNI